MITLFIVDDEKTTRDCIKDYIPWAELGVGQVETAENGLAALDLAMQSKPDIVLTDVRMPKMDGIELSKKIKLLYPECKIIFVSGYSDKEYLKSAINLKALSYIEKPVNIEEIKSVMRDTVALCMDEEKKRNDELEIRSRINESLPSVFQKITFDLIRGDFDSRDLHKKEYVPLLGLPENTLFFAMCVAFNWRFGLDSGAKNKTKEYIMNKLFDSNSESEMPSQYVAGFIEDDRMAFISSCCIADKASFSNFLLGKVEDISLGEYTSSVGVGNDMVGIPGIPESYRSSEENVRLQFYDGSGRVFDHNTGNSGKFVPEKGLLGSFKEALRNGQKENALDIIEKLTFSVQNQRSSNIENIKNIYFNLLLIVIEAARERGLIGSAEENENSYIWQDIDRFRFLSELSEYLENNVIAILTHMRKENSENKKICEINKYIRENVFDQDLSVQAVAHHFFLNHQYLCSFYKKATGYTLNDFMTEVRIEKSKELLKDSRKRVVDVASAVGFGDPNYFSSLFKKYTGLTPSEYREKN